MKKLFYIIIISFLTFSVVGSTFSQYRTGKDNILNKNTNLILGFINPANFTMKHSFQVSFLGSMYGNISLTSYINTLSYKFSDKLNISADISLQYSPYASSSFGSEYSKRLQNDFSGISLSRLSLDYKISDDASLKFEYRNINNPFYDPYYNNNNFYNNSIYDYWH